MKKHLYIIYDALLLICASGAFLGFTLYHRDNLLIVIFFIVAEAYFIQNIWKGICLIIDIIIGLQKKCTTFLGVLSTDTLDFFRVEYTNVYFDDDEMKKNYIAFANAIEETIRQGDKVEVKYYKYSRVILSIKKQPYTDDSHLINENSAI